MTRGTGTLAERTWNFGFYMGSGEVLVTTNESEILLGRGLFMIDSRRVVGA